jgi:hypothetical protein
VSAVGFGCLSFASFYGATSEGESLRALAGALDLGVDFWDTANIYGNGLSETLIGRFLAEGVAVLGVDPEQPEVGLHRETPAERLVDHDLRAGGQRGLVTGRNLRGGDVAGKGAILGHRLWTELTESTEFQREGAAIRSILFIRSEITF